MAPKSKAKGNAPQQVGEDTPMEDVASHQTTVEDEPVHEDEQGEEDSEEAEEEEEEETRVKLLPGSMPTAASFEFSEEGHTLGNALRYIIMKNPDVEFCAYAVPHPSEAKMNMRIQTYEGTGTTAIQALEKGLKDLQGLCDVVAKKFWAEREKFEQSMKSRDS